MSRSSTYKNKVRKIAFERDRKAHAKCWICEGDIDYDVPISSTPDSWEGDHYFPVSKNPELELDANNVKPCHKRCNRSRGDGENQNELGMRSRIW